MFPIFAICEKFPVWTAAHGTGRSVGVGGILILFVLLIIFRRTVFRFIRDRFHLKHAPPLAVWLAMLILSYIMVYISNFMRDMTTVFWMGFIGCAIGTFLTFIAENKYKE
jgi:ABC-type phosphate/phosphonate transport system permease subunit